ncbi:MAG: DNA repair protein RadC [Cyclobacteriaceae bacterium]|nr:DNA repair protein RadC [Cyclobacteriaceae bacterium SS2]
MEEKVLSIKKWAEEDRPREKLLLKGKATLSEAELIGILLGSGTTSMSAVDLAKQLLIKVDYNLNLLAKLTVKDLMKFKGIGEAKAITIVSALELGRRRKETEIVKNPKITTARSAYDLMRGELMDLQYEEFWVLLLKRNNEVIKKAKISSGGISGTVVDPKIIFKYALDEMASSIILVHNHPSGNPRPSHYDRQLTKKLRDAGQFLDISVMDHIIFCDHDYYSFADDSAL